jgi:UDP-2,3-diacylglucosamine pyrophosphatase LpxH
MKTLVISDIHLGSPLVDKKLELMNLMKSEEYDTIVLNGDIFDIWEKHFDIIIMENFDFVKLIQSLSLTKKVYYLMGNHDPYIAEIKRLFPNVDVRKELKIDDILIIHGEQFDDMVTKYSWFAKILFIPNWFAERIFHINLKAFFREKLSISSKRSKPYFRKLIGDIEEEATEYYKDQCRHLIMGHTHTPKIVGGDDITYINCGDIIHNRVCLEFDENKKFKFIEV